MTNNSDKEHQHPKSEQPSTKKRRGRPKKKHTSASGRPSAKDLARSKPFADDREVEEVLVQADRLFREGVGASNSIGQYLRELRKYPPLPPEEERELAVRAQQGDKQAQDKLVRHNLRFVFTIAKKYQNRGVLLEDLVAEGNIGILRAVEKFNPEFGVKFISYSVWWIRQSIRAALAEGQRSVRLPLNRATQMARIHRAQKKFLERSGKTPTPEQLAEETDVPIHVVKNLLAIKRDTLSLDATELPEFGGEKGIPLSERIAAEEGTEELLDARFRIMDIDRALSYLPSRDQKILRLFYGLDGGPEHTLEEIGFLLGITRERVRQLRDRALTRLREMTTINLEDYHT